MQIFISHSSSNADVAASFCEYMEIHGQKCFLAPRDIRPGHEYAEELINGLGKSDLVVLLLSQQANDSPHVLREIEYAVSKKIPIIVYQLEHVALSKSMEYFLMTHQWIMADHSRDYNKVLDYVLETEGQEPVSKASAPVVKPKKASRAPIIFLLVLLLACVGVILFLLLNRDENSKPAADSSKESSQETADTSSTPGSQVTESTEPSSEPEVKVSPFADIKLGDTLVYGEYNGAPIEWRVLHMTEQDGQKIAILISQYILTMKSYDVPDSGRYNYDGQTDYFHYMSEADTDLTLQAYVRGDSTWRDSCIRTWLNADTELVHYQGQAPTSAATVDHKNGYSNEPGFLYHFTEEERSYLTEYRTVTPSNDLLSCGTIETMDKVFLLSAKELDWFNEADVAFVAYPTPECIEQDQSRSYEFYFAQTEGYHPWWLRTPEPGHSSVCYMVYGSIKTINESCNVAVEGYGIRPAICVKME